MSDSPKSNFNRKANKDFTFEDEPKKPAIVPKDAEDDGDKITIEFTSDNDNGDGDDDILEINFTADDGEISQDTLYDLASKSLPKTPEVQKVINYGSNLDYICLLTAIAVQEELKGKVPAAKLDQLTAAALVMGAENLDDIYDLFDTKTTAIVDEFLTMLMQDDRDDRVRDIHEFSKDTKRLFFCSIIADLQVTVAGLIADTTLTPPKKELKALGTIISRISYGDDIDQALVARAADFFNQVNDLTKYSLNLSLNDDGTADLKKTKPPSTGPKPPRR